MSFFENLNFSSSNEDGETEIAALSGAKRIVCLTGSGTRPLDLLISDAEEVIALDINPSQNALLHLKCAAIRSLDHSNFLSFLGIGARPSTHTYERIRAELPAEMRTYWDQNQKLVQAGVWYAGKWEKLLLWNARFLKLVRGQAIDALLSATTTQEQEQIWKKNFDDGILRSAVGMIGRPWIWKYGIGEPGGDFLPDPRAVGEQLAGSFARASGTFLFRTSDFAMLIFRGAHDQFGALPVHLRSENYASIRSRLSRLKIVQGGLTDLSRLGISRIDGFSLSDFGSYCAGEVYANCWRGVLEAAEPGAKFCERIFMNHMPAPFPSIKENKELSEALTQNDRAIVYNIRSGTLG